MRDDSMIASDPEISAWVAANAGAGKTYTLANRVARLLLGDAKPEKILCLTFTKAAAAEMQNRLFQQLGGWAMLPDDDERIAPAAEGEFAPGLDRPQVEFLMREEWARTADDILWRRTKLGLVALPEQVAALERYLASRAAEAAAPAAQTAGQ